MMCYDRYGELLCMGCNIFINSGQGSQPLDSSVWYYMVLCGGTPHCIVQYIHVYNMYGYGYGSYCIVCDV